MMILMVVSAVLVAVTLDRQQRRHRLEIEIECGRRGFDIPLQRPRISRFEGYLNVAVGSLLLSGGFAMGWMLVGVRHDALPPGSLQAPALFIAAGLVMVVAGGRVLLRSKGQTKNPRSY
jgi:hypothetical protein